MGLNQQARGELRVALMISCVGGIFCTDGIQSVTSVMKKTIKDPISTTESMQSVPDTVPAAQYILTDTHRAQLLLPYLFALAVGILIIRDEKYIFGREWAALYFAPFGFLAFRTN